MITRDNYEEFFLLYIDNELSVADRKHVEQFVAGNPDLAEEWEALLQCRILPDHGGQPVFAHKELLMKFGDAAPVEGAAQIGSATWNGEAAKPGDPVPVNDNNYEDTFLSYLDGELNERDGVLVEEFARLHPSKGLELEQLRQTISRPDLEVTFPDKESLYRKEARRRLLISPWWRMAAAAVVLGAVGILIFYHPAKQGQSLANGKGGVHPAVTPAGPASPALAKTEPKRDNAKKEGAAVTPATATTLYSSESRKKEKVPDDRGEREMEKRTVVEKITHLEGNAITAADPVGVPGPRTTVDAIDRAVGSQEAVIPKEKSSFATQALLNNSTASRDDDDNIETEPASTKKNKFRGIFRKVSRAFEKTADREDDGQRKVLIGAFQIALK